jgi:ATP-binding cassette, subfamily B, bacterial
MNGSRDNESDRAVDVIRAGLAVTPEFRRVMGAMVLAGVLLGLGRVTVPVLFQQIIDRGLLADNGLDRGELSRLVLLTLGVLGVVTAVSFLTSFVLIRVAERAMSRLRVTLLRRAVDLSLAEHARERQGDLVSRVTGDLETLTQFLDWGAYAWLVNTSIAATAVVVMFVYSVPLALVVIVSLLAMVPALQKIQRRQQRGFLLVRDRTGELLSDLTETLDGAEAVRAFGRQDDVTARLRADIDHNYQAQISANRASAVLFTVADVFGTLATSALMVAVVWFGPDWGVGLGEAVAFLFLIQMILAPVAELTEVIDNTSLALAGWSRATDLATRPAAIREPDHPRPIPSGPLAVDLDAVSFSYGDQPVLHEVDLHIDAGTSVAVVGPTGSGKTTFARLLCRLADPTAGVIRLSGVDLRQLDAADRRAGVRMVPQDGFLFAASLLDNVRRGRDGATTADIDAVVSDLGLRTWVDTLPQGIETVIGPAGAGLSVGERQLVALIRAGLADPGLLILDEATSSLDPATEQLMSAALERLGEGRSTVTVAHRLSTAERSDLIVVFDHGRVIEVGDHDALVDAGGRYASMHRAWARTAQERDVNDPA